MLNLTKQERLVLIFIGISALLGVGLNFYKKTLTKLDIQKIISQQQSFPKLNPVRDKSLNGVNLNTASLNDLAKIPAIGPAIAEAIIDLRKARGAFNSIEELKLIKGIGEAKFNQIKFLFSL